MHSSQKQKWKVGDLFTVKLANGTFVVGQVVDDSSIPNTASCAFFDVRLDCPMTEEGMDLTRENVIATASVVASHLDQGAWRVIGNGRFVLGREDWPNKSTRRSGWVGSKVRTGAILEGFLNGFYALAPWDPYHDPHYMDKLLFFAVNETHDAHL